MSFSKYKCPYIFQRGKRAGEACKKRPRQGGSCCSTHKKYESAIPKEKPPPPPPSNVIRKRKSLSPDLIEVNNPEIYMSYPDEKQDKWINLRTLIIVKLNEKGKFEVVHDIL